MTPLPAMRGEPDATINFPPEWKEGRDWLFLEMVLEIEHPDGVAAVAGGVLKDGSNLLGMVYPGGQRVMRISPDTDWAVEERFAGCQPAEAEKALTKTWQITVDSMARAVRECREEGVNP